MNFPEIKAKEGLVHTNFPWNSYGPMALTFIWTNGFQISLKVLVYNGISPQECSLSFLSQKPLWAKKIQIRAFRFLSLSVGLRKRKRKEISGNLLIIFAIVACCCGNMFTTKANAKENLGECICLSITKAKAKQDRQIFICNRFLADGRFGRSLVKSRSKVHKQILFLWPTSDLFPGTPPPPETDFRWVHV